jgi:hypothetical protein
MYINSTIWHQKLHKSERKYDRIFIFYHPPSKLFVILHDESFYLLIDILQVENYNPPPGRLASFLATGLLRPVEVLVSFKSTPTMPKTAPLSSARPLGSQWRLPGRFASFPAFTHSQAYSPGRLATPTRRHCSLLIPHSLVGSLPQTLRQLPRLHSLTSILAGTLATPTRHHCSLLITHRSLLILKPARSPGTLATPTRHHCSFG